MITIYGTILCPDCVEIKKIYAEKHIPFEFYDFNACTENLKNFLKIRDTNPLFDDVKKEGRLGIPCIVLGNGTVTLDMKDAWK